MIHTGDISHLSKAAEFDDADRIISQAQLDVHYVPGEHDFLDPRRSSSIWSATAAAPRAPAGTRFDASGVHFIGLVNVVDLKAGGLGNLGAEQLEWLEDDLKRPLRHRPRSSCSPTSRCGRSIRDWGWGTEDGAQALAYLKRFGSVTVLNGHIHQVMQKVEGNVTFHTARSTAFPQPAPGTAPSPGPMKVADEQLRTMLGSRQRRRSSRTSSASRSSTRRCRVEATMLILKQSATPRTMAAAALGAAAGAALAAFVVIGASFADTPSPTDQVSDRQFHLRPAELTVKAGTTVTWTNHDDIPHGVASADKLQIEGARYRRQLFVHLHHSRATTSISATFTRT